MRSIHGGSDGDPWSTFQSAAESLSNEDVVAWSDEQVRSGLRALLTEVNRLDALVSTGLGRVTGPVELEKACNRIRAHVDPDGAEPDPDASARRSLSISRSGSLFSVAGRLDAEGGATVLTALDALMRPPAPDDTRTAAQRRADAMGELAPHALPRRRLPSPAGVPPPPGLPATPPMLLPPNTT